ncbi:transcriptional regulator Spx [Brochothrix campestris]|uniref:Transcriptional regulator Spx n=1 Tax=Brochothrix campestris FSL F6-1037 TaxID=1265861 RepID=W7CSW1_9LIST|nr:transcriptional regulator Spx [Brochothrix campestris]EUJ39982.1 transcriptional regulator Spx [Brochothrix campestris FSL F6-1037]
MVTIYTTPSCTSCRKAVAWLKEHNIPFKEQNLFKQKLTRDQLKEILSLSENGTDDVISQKSKAFQHVKKDIDNYTLDELFTLMIENPTIMKRPILIDEKRLEVGFNQEDIRSFLPRKVRNYELSALQAKLNLEEAI